MNSLGNKIQSTFIVSISVVAVVAFLMLTINQVNSLQTQQLINTMTTEYSLISLSNDLAQTYNAVTRNPGDTQLTSNYQSLHAKLLLVLKTLNEKITKEEVKPLLAGVENTVRSVIRECDAGLAEIKQNKFTSLSDHYAQANKNNEFVNDNTRTLLGKELEILYTSQQNIQRTYIVTLIVTSILFLVIISVIIALARSFTAQLIKPLTSLSLFAKDIAGGNLQAMNSKMLPISNDEIGSLTESIRTMVNKLVDMLGQQQHANEEIKKTTDILKEKNDELGRMNALMVGRELKMVELKKELDELKTKVSN
jgi:nitrogen fixation/metabolism regulation signal transduction histidine kinase